mmetsp:Transcript_140292/g.198845  ORF Transcript_140292/g.198845 Transcript_140292/m.198845 type:complete len:209 (-) Transcript_140292:156-782(-)
MMLAILSAMTTTCVFAPLASGHHHLRSFQRPEHQQLLNQQPQLQPLLHLPPALPQPPNQPRLRQLRNRLYHRRLQFVTPLIHTRPPTWKLFAKTGALVPPRMTASVPLCLNHSRWVPLAMMCAPTKGCTAFVDTAMVRVAIGANITTTTTGSSHAVKQPRRLTTTMCACVQDMHRKQSMLHDHPLQLLGRRREVRPSLALLLQQWPSR